MIKTQEPIIGPDNGFDCAGKRYFVDMPESISIDRKAEFTIEELRIITGFDAKSITHVFLQQRAHFNKGEFTKVAASIETGLTQMADIQAKRDPIMWAATLFINTAEEDRLSVPSDAVRQQKIRDWAEGGVPYFFLQGCVETFSGTLTALCAASTPTSPRATKKKKPATPSR